MQLGLSEGETLLQDTVARLFGNAVTSASLREAEATGFDQDLWNQLVELGIVTMRAASPAEGGMSLLDAAIVAEQAGRFVAPVPVIEAIVAAALLGRAGAPVALQDRVAAGEVATIMMARVL